MTNPRTKGASGEREFCDYLYSRFGLESKPKRNLEQVRSGGADIICQPFAFEIKRCETLKLYDWWCQVKNAVSDKDGAAFGLIPVVAFRQNKRDWHFLISAAHINVDFSFIELHSEALFEAWAKKQIERYQNTYQKTNLNLPNDYITRLDKLGE